MKKDNEIKRILAIVLFVTAMTTGLLTFKAVTQEAKKVNGIATPAVKSEEVWLSDFCKESPDGIDYYGEKLKQARLAALFDEKDADFQIRYDKPIKSADKKPVFFLAYKSKDSKELLGYVSIGRTVGGYNDEEILLLVAIDKNMLIHKFEVVKLNDTPSFVQMVMKKGFVEKITGRAKKDCDNEDINIIGATYTCQGLKACIKFAYENIANWKDKSYPGSIGTPAAEKAEPGSKPVRKGMGMSGLPKKEEPKPEEKPATPKQPVVEPKKEEPVVKPEPKKEEPAPANVPAGEFKAAEDGTEYTVNETAIGLAKLKALFPQDGAKFIIQYADKDKKEIVFFEAQDVSGKPLGYILIAKAITGYNDEEVILAVAIAADLKLAGMKILKLEDTPEFVALVRKKGFFENINGRSRKDCQDKKLNVSGATYTCEGIKKVVELAYGQLEKHLGKSYPGKTPGQTYEMPAPVEADKAEDKVVLPQVEDGKEYASAGCKVTLEMMKSVLKLKDARFFIKHSEKKEIIAFIAKDEAGETLGMVAVGSKNGGYRRRVISVLVGAEIVDSELEISGVRVISFPDDKWFVKKVLDSTLLKNVEGRILEELSFGEIKEYETSPLQAVSRATYSSVGLVDSIRQALSLMKETLDDDDDDDDDNDDN